MRTLFNPAPTPNLIRVKQVAPEAQIQSRAPKKNKGADFIFIQWARQWRKNYLQGCSTCLTLRQIPNGNEILACSFKMEVRGLSVGGRSLCERGD
jgi:hypothetical protein